MPKKYAVEGIKNKSVVITNWWHPKLVKFNLKKNEYALAIGRLEKVKGFDLLITSWKNIKTNLVIVGSGQEKQNLKNLINQNNLSTRIKIVDDVKRDELINFYKNASVLIISSRDEGGPRVALEAPKTHIFNLILIIVIGLSQIIFFAYANLKDF